MGLSMLTLMSGPDFTGTSLMASLDSFESSHKTFPFITIMLLMVYKSLPASAELITFKVS